LNPVNAHQRYNENKELRRSELQNTRKGLNHIESKESNNLTSNRRVSLVTSNAHINSSYLTNDYSPERPHD